VSAVAETLPGWAGIIHHGVFASNSFRNEPYHASQVSPIDHDTRLPKAAFTEEAAVACYNFVLMEDGVLKKLTAIGNSKGIILDRTLLQILDVPKTRPMLS